MYERILVVEDEPPLRYVIVQNLVRRGHLVREASTAEEALAALQEERPDLILLDINLPDQSGWDVLRKLKEKGISVPAIIISAVRVSQNRLDEFHPLAYLPKPFPLETLLRLIGHEYVAAEAEQNER